MAREVVVTSLDGYACEIRTGPHTVVFDAPPAIGGADRGPSPAEMLLGAMGS